MAPTGQTAAHWPHCTQTTSARSMANAGPMTVLKPRFCGNRAPTPWIWLQTVTHRRQDTHLPVSRTRAGVERVDLAVGLLALVGDLVDVELLGQAAQLAVGAAHAGLAVAGVLGEEQLEDGPAPAPGPAGGRVDHHAVGGRLHAGSDEGLGALDFHQAQPAGADGLHALQVAESGDVGAGLPAGVKQGSALGHLDLDVVNGQDWHYFTSSWISAAATGILP